MMDDAISINKIPRDFFESTQEKISHFTIGFSKLTGQGENEDVELLGSGTLIKVNNIHAILTAHHVLEILPKTGRLGLILSKDPRKDTIDVLGVQYLKIGRGVVDSDGPDLAAVILSPLIASSLASRKTFYSLDKHKEKSLVDPPLLQYGVWCNIGLVAEKTIEEAGRNGYQKIKRFCMLGGFGGPDDPPVLRDEYDYLQMPVTYGVHPGVPISFGGMSGGGLWQVQLIKDESSGIKSGELLLSGVVFYQEALIDERRNIICHGRKSVYEIAYEAIKKHPNKATE